MGIIHYKQREQPTFLTTAAQIISQKRQQTKILTSLPFRLCNPEKMGSYEEKKKSITLAQKNEGRLPNVRGLG